MIFQNSTSSGFIGRPRADVDNTVADLHRLFAGHHDASKKVFADLSASIENINGTIDDLASKVAGLSITGGGAHDRRRSFEPLLAYLRNGQVQATMTTQSNPDGGFITESAFDRQINDQLISISPIRAISRVVQVTNASDFKAPIGRRGASSAWVGETEEREETTTPQLGLVTPPGGELMSYASASQWLLDDSSFDVEDWLKSNILDEHALQEGAAFVSGDGVKKPKGFLAGPTPVTTGDATRPLGTLEYLPTGSSGAFMASPNSADCLVDVVYKLAAPYRQGAAWVMNSSTAGMVRKLKNDDGQWIWQQSAQQGQPERLLGFPVVIAEDMPAIAANTFSIAFGNFQRGYVVVDKVGTRVLRDPFTRPGWVKIYMYRRVHGAVTDSNAIKLLKFSAS